MAQNWKYTRRSTVHLSLIFSPQINGFSSQNMLKVYAAYSAIIVQIFYAFVF
jgi:hypothetical protein